MAQKAQFILEAVDNASPSLKKATDSMDKLGDESKQTEKEVGAA